MNYFFYALVLVAFWGCGPQNVTSQSNQSLHEPLIGFEWHLHTPDPAFASAHSIDPASNIHLDDTLLRTLGEGVTIAVIDAYFDPTHPDIASNVKATYNVRNGSTDVTTPNGIDDPHGQLCAGAAAAAANGIGLAGVAPKAKLILIGVDLDGSDADFIKAFEFAKTHEADIISCSWGSYQVSQALSDEIQSIYDANITVIFAAGNDNYDLDNAAYSDESELPWVIGVSASSEYNDRASYANYGSAIDLLAPGGERIGVPSTDTCGEKGYSPRDPYVGSLSSSLLGDDYAFFTGTSAAAPVTAGAAALLKSIHPTLTPKQIRELLIDSADKIGGAGLYDANGFSLTHAYGKINVDRAVANLLK